MKKSLKKVLALALTLAMFETLLAGCGSPVSDSEDEQGTPNMTIGYICRDNTSTFCTAVRDHTIAAAEALGMTVEHADGKSNSVTISEQLDVFIAKGYKGVIINMQEVADGTGLIQKCRDAGVAVAFIVTEPTLEDLQSYDHAYYVGSIGEDCGRMQGAAYLDYLKEHPEADRNGDGKIQYIMLSGTSGHQDTNTRTTYSIQELKDNGYEVEELGQAFTNWETVQAYDNMTAFMAAHGNEIEVVFANCDDIALGAIEAMRAVGYNDGGDNYIPVIGVDATDAGKDAVRSGSMIATVLQDGKNQGAAAAEIIAACLKGEEPANLDDDYSKYAWVPYVPVDQSNVDSIG